MSKRKGISKQDLKRVKELDLLTYFKNYEPDELVKNSRGDYTTRTHSSLHLSNGLWCWWAQGIGGKTALKYLIEVEGWEFLDAALHIKDLLDDQPPVKVEQKAKSNYRFRLPNRAENDDKAINYLINERCIDKEIAQYCKENYLFYEAESDHSVVFIGYDEHRLPRYACKRATDDNWKKDVLGSDKQYSFSLSNNESHLLHVFESVIDLLSYMTLLKRSGRDYLKDNYLSISGATSIGKFIQESTVPIALETFLNNNKNITDLYLHLDNDKAGKDTTLKIIYHYEHQYNIIDEHPTKCKDFNDLLILKRNQKKHFQVR
ncbi:DUF3991 domain-containing protein [[Clostridium] innocuum]|uniref:DUF3991 domain-containing protein n=1 Tax=Clostridium innocuum TaxID=1522 RepID=UPI0012B225F6|nr:DUF3991 and TOPRIM domain-containing protein [[Clostridium] innocuum]MSS22534.1 DUF3991 domain-containing protein [[Clostridium] innocuum]